MRTSVLCLLLASLLAVGGCKSPGPGGLDPSEKGFAIIGHEVADERTPTPRSIPLTAVAAAEEEVVRHAKEHNLFDGYRIVARERAGEVYTTYLFEALLQPATTYGSTTLAPIVPRPGEVLLDLETETRFDTDSFEGTFKLVVRSPDAVLGAHSIKLRAELRGGRFQTEAELQAAVRSGFDRMRAIAVRVLIERLRDDPITLDAIEAQGRVRSQPERPKAPATPALPAPRATAGRTFVLAVGVDDYADPAITDLRAAENDARDAAAFYALHRRSPAGPERVVTLLGSAATRASVLAAVREHLGQATDAEDAVVLYFAGHGFTDSHDAYLAAADTELARLPETAIAMSQLKGYWDRLGATSRLVLVDACHAGALAGLRGVGGIARPKDDPAATRPLGERTIVVAASAPEQLSAEHAPLARGVFTTALLHGLSGDADVDGDRVVTLGEMKTFLEAEVPRRARIAGARQTPVVVAPAGADATALTR